MRKVVIIDVGYNCGKLTVIRESSVSERPKNDKSHTYYKCLCDCGNTTIVKKHDLIRHHKLSCGCHRKSVGTAHLKKWRSNGGINSNSQFVGDVSGTIWYRIMSNAKERNLNITITKKDAWNLFQKQNGICALTGMKLTLSPLSKDKHTNTASLDRIDSSLGYSENNVQWIHKDINLMKLDFPNEYFIAMCKRVAETHK